jgi:hypothetical protein
LRARIRSQLGRSVQNMHDIDVTAREGHITLRGYAPSDQIDAICREVKRVGGVVGVDSHLIPRGSMPGGIASDSATNIAAQTGI